MFVFLLNYKKKSPKVFDNEFSILEADDAGLTEIELEEMGNSHQLATEGEFLSVRHPGGMKIGNSTDGIISFILALFLIVHENYYHFPMEKYVKNAMSLCGQNYFYFIFGSLVNFFAFLTYLDIL